METAALVLGIVALVLGCGLGGLGLGWIGIICAIVGVVLGAIGVKKAGEKKGRAKAGMIMSIIALAISIIFTIACAICFNKVKKAVQDTDWNKFADELSKTIDENSDADDADDIDLSGLEGLFGDLANALQGVVDEGTDALGDFTNSLNDGLQGLANDLGSLGN